MKIRPATEDDLADLARIFDSSSTWLTEQYRPDQALGPAPTAGSRDFLYRHLLRTGGVFLAEDPEPAGFSAAIVRDGVWFLSLLWVLPESHGSGIGSALLDEALAWGRDSSAFSVVASPYPVAQLIYLRRSMYPLWVQMDLAGEPPAGQSPDGLEDLLPSDQDWVDQLDREVRGVARPEDHELWQEVAHGLALRRDGKPVGYIYGARDGKVGPGAVSEPSDLPVLISGAAKVIPAGIRATAAIPSANWTAISELVRLGFKPTGSNMFMATRPMGDPRRYISSGGALC
ncbi:MAG: GNAT family N-acetyltransferase [Actinomycetota bacterium]